MLKNNAPFLKYRGIIYKSSFTLHNYLIIVTTAPCLALQSLYLATTSMDQSKISLPCPDSNSCKSAQGSRRFAGTVGDK